MQMILLLVAMFAIMYFLMIRPQQKKMREDQEMRNQLAEGDRVLLTSGIFATIAHVGERQMIVELAPGLEVTILKGNVARKVTPEDEEFEFTDEVAPAVADEYEFADSVFFPQFFDFTFDGGGVLGVSWEHFDGHGAAFGVGEQADDDLFVATFAVAVVAKLGQRTGRSLEVTGGKVVEHQTALTQMTRREFLLDSLFVREQPVHRRVQIVLARVRNRKILGQCRRVPRADGGQFGLWVDDARGDHGQNKVTLAAGLGGDQRREPEPLHRRCHGVHMALRARTRNLERLPQGDERLALQRAPNDIYQCLGQMREIAQCLVLYHAAFAVTATQ